MAAEPIAVLLTMTLPRGSRAARVFPKLADYWALTKPDVNFLILITTFAGFRLAGVSAMSGGRVIVILRTLLGTR